MKKYALGIDVGSVAIGIAVVDAGNRIRESYYAFHNGQFREMLATALKDVPLSKIGSIAYTSSTPPIMAQGKLVDARVASITAARHFHTDMRALLILGAEKFGLATFDENGEYRNFVSNTSCAAGTGNFLDQQVERLNLKSIEEFSDIAFSNQGSFPKIASRCAVFAKTDLIHAQQEGYSLAEICDGLSYGLAKNIADTVFHNNTYSNVVASGGVAKNKAVIGHIEDLIGKPIEVDQYAHLYGAIGAAIICKDENNVAKGRLNSHKDILSNRSVQKKFYYPPLQLSLSDYPEFDSHEQYAFHSPTFPDMGAVEIDVYSSAHDTDIGKVLLGVDIGSTSTKSVVMDEARQVVAGFYARTLGRPVMATQLLMEALIDFADRRKIHFAISGVGTTGSGRKFVGKIIGADVILDEITAHAKAAYELDPKTDTIIEIGGQDSKFTTMRDGMVTFSIMNNVCAAGTGSFIEEQAKRLGCPLEDYSRRVENISAPMTSNRCTVFMERDINHFLMAGYSTTEILAAVLHATQENYFSKVAIEGHIRKKIFFQGATAKNRALVAAFEQKLNKPIMVSRYCHLTGALGVALHLHDQRLCTTKFRGLELYKQSIPVRSEVCDICTNHCKMKIAEINDQIETYGLLCEREYHTRKHTKRRPSDFQLISKRKEICTFKAKTRRSAVTIGIPAGLHLYDELLFWRKFFDLLSIRTITSEKYASAVKDGKNLSNAEFCAPVAAMHGHVDYLRERADYIFLPTYIKDPESRNMDRQYCYYTQFVPSIISVHNKFSADNRVLSPLLKYTNSESANKRKMYEMLKSIGLNHFSYNDLVKAFEHARKHAQGIEEQWASIYQQQTEMKEDIHIVLLGRPYVVLHPFMNKNIPEIIEKMGIGAFYMDMLPAHQRRKYLSDKLIASMKWKYAADILAAAKLVANTRNCYPVLVTSFKCTPDSFVAEYVKELFDRHQKPYLILQLDEHDSSVGYETRIEAGIRAFRNHRERLIFDEESLKDDSRQQPDVAERANTQHIKWQEYIKSLVAAATNGIPNNHQEWDNHHGSDSQLESDVDLYPDAIFTSAMELGKKTLLLPSWDQHVGPLLEAVLQHSGVDARVVHSAEESMQRGLRANTGQCIPLNIIVQNAIDYIRQNDLEPGQTALWIMKSKLSCNLPMFPYFMRKLLKDYGNGMEQVSVYQGDLVFYDFSLKTAINAYLAHMLGGYVRSISCRIRPYEVVKGATNQTADLALKALYDAFLYGKPKDVVAEKIVRSFKSIETTDGDRPKVSIFGDLYARDNDMMNQDLIETIEANGGEVITTPFSEFMKIVIDPHVQRCLKEGFYKEYAKLNFLRSLIPLVEEKFRKYFDEFKGEEVNFAPGEIEEWLDLFGLHISHRGESLENILKIQRLVKQYPDIELFIQTNPSYCCPSLVTQAMTSKIEQVTGVPVVTIEYDGTTEQKNASIIPYLEFRRKKIVHA